MREIEVVCVCSLTQSCLTLCDLMDCSPPGSSVHGIFPARILEWAIQYFLLQGIFPIQGLNPLLLLGKWLFFLFFFTPEPPGKPQAHTLGNILVRFPADVRHLPLLTVGADRLQRDAGRSQD